MPLLGDNPENREAVPVSTSASTGFADSSPRSLATGTLVVTGTVWSLVQTLGTKVVALGGQLVLAWLLAKEDFGQIGMAYTVTAFVTLLTNPGIDLILVRRGRRFDLWSTPAFYFSLFTGVLGCATILIVAPIVAQFYKSPQLTGLLEVLALATPFGSLLLVPTAKLRSQMRFRALATINLLQSFVQTVLTVLCAATGFGVYAFVLPMPFVYLVSAALLWGVARPRVRIRRPFQYWQYLIGDTSFIFGQRALQTAVNQGDYITLGALFGAAVVGPYFFAFGIATQAIRLTAGSLQLVLTAGLSRFLAFSEQQTRAALRATKAIVLLGLPLCILQACIAGPVLRAIYGEKWADAIPLVQLISVGMAFDVASWTAASLLQSRGQFRFLFWWSSIFAPIFLAAVYLGATFGGSLGVALAVCWFYALLSPLLTVWVFRSSGVEWTEILDIYWRPVIVGALTAGTTFGVVQLAGSAGLSPLWQSGLAACVGLGTMGVGARVIMSSAWHEVTSKLIQVFPSLSPSRS